MKRATQINLNAFNDRLAAEYTELFKTPDYSYAASQTTPGELARKMTLGLDNGTANLEYPDTRNKPPVSMLVKLFVLFFVVLSWPVFVGKWICDAFLYK